MNQKIIQSLKEIKTPLAFLSLVVLVAEGGLIFLMNNATGGDLTIVIISFVLLPFACLVTLCFLYRQPSNSHGSLALKDEVQGPSGRIYDLFVSSPMAAFDTEKEFQSSRNSIFDVVRGIKKNVNLKMSFTLEKRLNATKTLSRKIYR